MEETENVKWCVFKVSQYSNYFISIDTAQSTGPAHAIFAFMCNQQRPRRDCAFATSKGLDETARLQPAKA